MGQPPATGLRDQLSLEPWLVSRLAAAQEQLGRLWPLPQLWPAFAQLERGPLLARAAAQEVRHLGLEVNLAELLGLGPEPRPTRPAKALRWAVGLTLAFRQLEAADPSAPLVPSLVGQICLNLDAPHLARGAQAPSPPAGPLAGAAVWTLAPRMAGAGIAPLMVVGLTLASWEREGPDTPQRSPAGRVLAWGLARGLGLMPTGFLGLAPALMRAAQDQPGGLPEVLREVRQGAAWRRWLGVFLGAVELAAQDVANTALAARELYLGHQDMLTTWVRAPRHPLRLLELFLTRPVLELPLAAEALGVTQRTAGLLAGKLLDQGLIQEITGQQRGRRFAYAPLIELLEQ
ncbi:MAG: hypothetical protein HY910_13525 [Desulfarculus sp.]|nr:hypothetical protein [Desulfarculus sp.]